MSPAPVVKLVPQAATADAASDLAARVRTLESAARRVRRAEGGEALHDLRVASRRLSATLELWAPRLGTSDLRPARRRVRDLRRALRDARDHEVTRAGLLERMPGADADTRDVLGSLVARLERRLRRDARAVRRVARRARIARIRRAVERAVERARAHADDAPGDAAARAAMARAHVAERGALARRSLAAATRERTAASWHAARLDLKRWRYAIEGAMTLLGADAPEAGTLPALRTAQEALGRVQDVEVLAVFVRRRAARAATRGAAGRARVLEAFATSLAHEQGEAMQACYRLATTLSTGDDA